MHKKASGLASITWNDARGDRRRAVDGARRRRDDRPRGGGARREAPRRAVEPRDVEAGRGATLYEAKTFQLREAQVEDSVTRIHRDVDWDYGPVTNRFRRTDALTGRYRVRDIDPALPGETGRP